MWSDYRSDTYEQKNAGHPKINSGIVISVLGKLKSSGGVLPQCLR